ncbi:unnamed protein product [Zymoseptoria tritici ST99CH_3D1]|uniref:Uncharacterized protein n=1 Tax=Zymoseptoria tritici ST99CH_1E4 TaxID=1276532 RepID=A0A2H1G5A0_ZYMTR|nr:unnamed protein product [Zymoseptoria tritici ST99CH_1E4]SMR49926.1 unnamed protein product [Zymoseptoria tritici ST99CH_3D1]
MPQAGLGATQQLQQSKQYAALSDHLSSNPTALDKVIDHLSEPVESCVQSSANSDEVDEHLTTTWKAIIAKAAETSFKDASSSKLVDVVMQMQSRPDVKKDGSAFQVEKMTLWKDLPTFGWQMRDAWNLVPEERSDQQTKDHWINLNAFTASLVAAAESKSNGKPDFSLYCIWTVRDGLEEDLEMVPDFSIAAAATWFVFAAPTIKKFCREEKSFEGKMAKGGFEFQERGWTGFSEERWQVWEERLKVAEGRVKDESTKELVQQALKAVAEN